MRKIWDILRGNEWWNSNVPFLLNIVFVYFFYNKIEFLSSIKIIGFWFIFVIGMAGFGYFTNDWGDIQFDLKIKKQNIAAKIKPLMRFLIAFLLFTMPYFSAVLLKKYILIFILILLNQVLFVLYSFFPIRLKEKAFWGAFADAVYAFVLPTIITILLVFNKSDIVFDYKFFVFVTWLFITGLRNILGHQITDYENDSKYNVSTWCVRIGNTKAEQIHKIFILIEILAFSVLTSLFAEKKFISASILILFGLFLILSYIYKNFNLFIGFSKPVSVNLNKFYEHWLPIIFLTHLIFIDIYYIVLIFAMGILFSNILLIQLFSLLYYKILLLIKDKVILYFWYHVLGAIYRKHIKKQD